MTARPGTRSASDGVLVRFPAPLALGVLLALVGCTPKPTAPDAAKAPAAVAVTVAPVTAQTVRRTIPVTGTLSGFEDVTLSPKVDGRILAAKYNVGDPAVPGAVLMEIDPADHEKAVELEKRSLAAELARLGLTDIPPDTEFKLEDVPEVQRAEAARLNARRTYERVKGLAGASKSEVDGAETEQKVAEANKRSAETTARATLAAARMRKASLDLAEQRLTDCKVRVPVPDGWAAWAGVVGPGYAPLRYTVAQKMASEGEVTRSMMGTNVYRLVIGHVLQLKATVPERHAPEVRVGQTVEVRVDAYPDPFQGRVARVNPTIDPASRTFQVEVEVPNAHGKLKPGGFARAQIVTGTAEVAAVPPPAVVAFAGVTKVFVVDGDKAKEVLVEPGTREKDWVEVSGPVKPGATVITSGFSQLYDGSPIKVR